MVLSSFVLAQKHRFHQYRVEQGLPGDVIKSVTEDSLGYLWIATDDGLVKYDGVKFTTYKNALRSQYTKGFLHTKDGRLLAFSDLDLIEIKNYIDTVIFSPVLRGERFMTDSTVHYPKALYEDKEGAIWIAEPRSIVRYHQGQLRRFDFSEQNRSPVFVRSFSFFEDSENNFYAVAFNGNIFRLDRRNDDFIQQKGFQLPEEVSQVAYVNKKLLIAGRNGLYAAAISNGSASNVSIVIPGPSFSNILLLRDSSIIASTYLESIYHLEPSLNYTYERLGYTFNGTNSCYQSKEGDIWVATDKGLVLVQENIFQLADLNSQAHFVEGIAASASGETIWYASKEQLVRLDRDASNHWNRKVILSDKSHYFLSLQGDSKGVWASSTWNVLQIQDDKIVRSWDFSSEGNFIHDILIDSQENLWLTQGGFDRVRKINSSDYSVESFRVEGVGQREISNVHEGGDGIYAVASGVETYIYFKEKSDSVFRNISVPIPFDIKGDLEITHFSLQGKNIWLATTDGLLLYDRMSVSRILPEEDFARLSVSCVEVLDDENILFSNSLGLFRYNTTTREFWLYDEHTGLPSNTIADHGILVLKDGGLWIGTSFGIATTWEDIRVAENTRPPYCVDARINGMTSKYAEGLQANYGSFISLRFSAISFPENRIVYQWRMNEQSRWNTMEHGHLELSNLNEGIYQIEVRAKKNTGLGWSAPSTVELRVDLPYWKKTEFIFLIILLIIIIAWASYAISSIILSQRKKYLQEQVDARTLELKIANEELTLRNTELDRFVYSASHDLSAPLKSILGLIQVAKMDQPGDVHRQYLDMMERSVYKLEEFIQEVVTYSRNTRMPINLERFNFRSFVEGLLQDHQFSPNFSHIRFLIEDETDGEMISDATRMKIILNNLLSNAIKFHWIEKDRDPFILIRLTKEQSEYILEVRDNGRGIKDEHISRIFEMFYRATDETQGSGLGLYILRETVHKLGGRVYASSKLNEGTSFRIHLPVPVTA